MEHEENYPDRKEAEEVEKIRREPRVSRALAETKNAKAEVDQQSGGFNRMIFVDLALFAAAAVLNLLLRSGVVVPPDRFRLPLEKLLLCMMAATAILFLNALLRSILKARIDDKVRQYNVTRVSNLTAAVLIAVACLTILFTNWYGALVSFGVITLFLALPSRIRSRAFSDGFTSLFENPMKLVTG